MSKLSLNGEIILVPDSIDISTLLNLQGYRSQKIAVAINGEFVSRSSYTQIILNEGDEVDVIQAIGGG